MRFDEEKLTSIQRYLDKKWPMPRTCPICQENPDHWRLSETPILLPLLTGSAEISVSSFKQAADSLAVAPAFALTCSNCGHIILFSAAQKDITHVDSGDKDRFSIPSEKPE